MPFFPQAAWGGEKGIFFSYDAGPDIRISCDFKEGAYVSNLKSGMFFQ
jgi:hypothetical protein